MLVSVMMPLAVVVAFATVLLTSIEVAYAKERRSSWTF
jgi:hypothetical protein